jgi:hypothetical protein
MSMPGLGSFRNGRQQRFSSHPAAIWMSRCSCRAHHEQAHCKSYAAACNPYILRYLIVLDSSSARRKALSASVNARCTSLADSASLALTTKLWMVERF